MELSATLKAVRGKAGTEARPGPIYEIVFTTDDPEAAASLQAVIGQEMSIDLQRFSPPMTPIERAITDADTNGTVELAPRSGRRRGTAATVAEEGP